MVLFVILDYYLYKPEKQDLFFYCFFNFFDFSNSKLGMQVREKEKNVCYLEIKKKKWKRKP